MESAFVWKNILDDLMTKSNPLTIKTWIQPVQFTNNNENVSLKFPNQFFKSYVIDHLGDKLHDSIKKALGESVIIEYVVDENIKQPTEIPAPLPEPKQAQLNIKEKPNGKFNSKFNFSNFVIGTGNQFAYAAACAVSESPASQYNPLFIYSESGLGKTHLLHAIANRLIERNPNIRICYVHCEQFVNEVVEGIRYEQMTRIRNKYRDSFDVLLMDDIQFIAGKDRSQEEFFHTFNYLVSANKQVVLTSDKVPKDLHGLEDRLRTRFESGLLADIQAPDLETRIAILTTKAECDDIYLPHEVKVFIATHIRSNVRELEGALVKLGAQSSLIGREIDLPMAKEVLKDIIDDRLTNLSIEHIQRVVCSFYKLKIQDLKGRNRTKSISTPRQVAMYICRKMTKCSTTEIGIQFGGKDHTTVLHASEKIENELKTNPDISNQMKEIENLL